MGALDGFFDAQKSALNSQDRFVETRARNTAGRKLATRDYAGAATELYDAGQLEAGSEVQNFGQAQDDRTKKAGDGEMKRRGEFLLQLATGLETVPDGERDAQFEKFAPALKTLGADDDLIEQLRKAPKDNASLRMFGAGIKKQLEIVKASDGSYSAVDTMTGKPVHRYDAPLKPEYKTVGEGDTLVEIGGAPGASGAPAASGAQPPAMAGGVQEAVQKLIPGARITSGRRTPERNAAVGGAPKSHHLTGNAMDITPPPGMDMKQLEAALRGSGMQFEELINEGDHVHIAWAGEGLPQGGARVVARGAPKKQEAWVDLPGGGQRNTVTGKTDGIPKTSGRLPATALSIQNESLGAIQTGSAINTRLNSIVGQLEKGALNLGPLSNIGNSALNFAGASTPGSANYASFRADLEKLRNDSLRLNKGVQTEGDAVRAWKELLANLNDERVVQQRLREIQGYNGQALAFHQDVVSQLREDAGLPPIDASRFQAKPSPRGAQASKTPARASAPASVTGAPRVGEVRKGYKFNGGDPSKAQNWTKVQ